MEKIVPFNCCDDGDLESGRKEGITKGLVLLFGSVAIVFLFFFFKATVEMKVGMLCRMWPESLGSRKPCRLRYMEHHIEINIRFKGRNIILLLTINCLLGFFVLST